MQIPLAGSAQIDVVRAGKPQRLTIALEVAPNTGRDELVIKSRSPFQGAKVSNISPAVADELPCSTMRASLSIAARSADKASSFWLLLS